MSLSILGVPDNRYRQMAHSLESGVIRLLSDKEQEGYYLQSSIH
jgi:hypothetical protein